MFFYIKNTNELEDSANRTTIPISWMWSKLPSGTVGWTAATYFASFWIYLIVSVVEMVAWAFYLAG